MIAQFALRLVCGMSLMWSLMPRSQVTSGFFRIQMLVALGLSVLAALTYGQFTGQTGEATSNVDSVGRGLMIAIAVAAFAGSVMWTLERRTAGTVFVFLIAGMSIAALLLSTEIAGSPASAAAWFLFGSELTAAGLLGSAVTGMLLGHWYLTAPTMSIAPLSNVTLYFGVAAVLRTVVAAVGLALVWSDLAGMTHATWLLLRWGAGLAGPLVMVAMTWRILKFRNTQAATGVLFVGVILVFIGEMTAALLLEEFTTPL